MNPAPCPAKTTLARIAIGPARGPFPTVDLRRLQELGPIALRMFLEQRWRPDEKRGAE